MHCVAIGRNLPQNTLSSTKSAFASRVVAVICHPASAAAAAATKNEPVSRFAFIVFTLNSAL
jgi:hypothetical protein